jgi:hypothetical protein
MNNQRLPLYPEHAEPNQRIDAAEFERETKPRTMPGTMVWMGVALLVGLFFTQKFIAQYVGKEQPIGSAPAKPRGN